MGENDWLERGHGGGDGLRPMIRGSAERASDRVSIRGVLRGGDAGRPRKPRRRHKALVGWLLYCCTAVAGTAAAFTVRDTLFPSLGGPTKTALWVNPQPETPLTTEHGSPSTGNNAHPAVDEAAAVEAAVAAAVTAGVDSSVKDQTVPSASGSGSGKPGDNQGPSASAAPSTGTTVAHNPTGVQSTIVDENPVESSTSGPVPSRSDPGPSHSDDPTSTTVSSPTSSTPSSTTTPVEEGKGKGKGGGGDGHGGGGTEPPTTT